MNSNNGKDYPNVKLIDPINRYKDFEITFPPPAFPQLQRDFENPPDSGEKTYKGRGRLQGLKALVTGGDSGIGRAVVLAFLREGATVAINYLPAEEPDVDDFSRFLAKEGLSVERIPGDLRNERFCDTLVNWAAHRMGGLDILVNNAGMFPLLDPNSPPSFSTADLKACFETNVYAPYFLVRAAIQVMPRGGSIIFTASGVVTDPHGFGVEYGASKGAVTYMVRGLAQQLASRGIRVNGVAPGFTYTPLAAAAGAVPGLVEQFAATFPFQRLAQPAELAPLYVSLADPVQSYTSGEIFAATGGSIGV
ncbi:short-chain alcohol dehydrogenase like protein [Stachybotrys elegans]|uniref:Short-chain alcohol dehydrogenase like protein n=1 Tax=Stachybotrys elegans TaxID=80388 RepID=A0A8K0SX77_9HYPO|nr:short-chain alcohol dehydrogenase like protein [Stachybotrys elegans]